MSGILQLFATGSGYSAQALALFARMSTPPTEARKVLINNAIVALVNAGVWAKLDALYVTAAADSQAAGLNWLSTSYNLTVNGSPTFTTDRGFNSTLGGSTAYLDTNLNATSLSQNDLSFSVWYRNPTANAVQYDGADNNTTWAIEIGPRNTAGNAEGYVNSISAMSAANTTSGLLTTTRTASTTTALYKNGSSIASGSAASVAATSVTLRLLGFVVTPSTMKTHAVQEAAAAIGSGLSAQNALDLYTALQAYMTGVGA